MAKDRKTTSERLFEEFCELQGIRWRSLPVQQGRGQPDYELELGGGIVVAEVKQIDRNDEDEKYHKALMGAELVSGSRSIDASAARIRNHINESRSQLQSYINEHPGTSAILIIFDNADHQYTDPYIMKSAMHGWEQVTLRIPENGEPTVSDVGFGRRNNKTLRKDKNTHLSAVVTLHEHFALKQPHERSLSLCFYHNPFADQPFQSSWWRGASISHWSLGVHEPGCFQEWVELENTDEV